MRFRPGTPVRRRGVQGEGLLVVDPGNGCAGPLLRRSHGPACVPTLRAVLRGDRVWSVRCHADARRRHRARRRAARRRWRRTATASPHARARCRSCAADGVVLLVPLLRGGHRRRHPREPRGARRARPAGRRRAGRRRVEPRPRRGAAPAAAVRVAGRRGRRGSAAADAGPGSGWRRSWSARETSLAREHPDWLVGPRRAQLGPGPGRPRPHPPGRRGTSCRARCSRLADLGVDYFKLDFLYAGAVPGRRHDGRRRGRGLPVGPGAHARGGRARRLPARLRRADPASVGLVDAMRVSPDTFHEGGEDGSAGLRGLMPLAARAWQQGRLWVNDPDCLVARPSYPLRERWADAVTAYGGLRSFSDRVAELDEWGLAHGRDAAGARAARGDAVPGRDGPRGGAGSPRRRSCGRGHVWPRPRSPPGSRRSSSCSTPTGTTRSCADLVALAERYAAPAGRPPDRAAEPRDRLPDHLRRRHPAARRDAAAHPGRLPARPGGRRGQRRAPAADVPVDLRRRLRGGRPPGR